MVKISSHQESTIDYPGKMGEIFFVSGCNFRCGFCHNPELVEGKMNEIDLDALLKNINSKARTGWYQGITISGGEPTIYNDLPEFARRLKEMNLDVKLDTNGSNPEMLEILLKNRLIDYIAMDIKGPREKYLQITGMKDADMSKITQKIEKSIKLVSDYASDPDYKIKYEFRTTIVPTMYKRNEKERLEFMSPVDVLSTVKWVIRSGGRYDSNYYLQKFIARGKEEMLDERFSKENLPKELQETPDELLYSRRDVVREYFPNCKVR